MCKQVDCCIAFYVQFLFIFSLPSLLLALSEGGRDPFYPSSQQSHSEFLLLLGLRPSSGVSKLLITWAISSPSCSCVVCKARMVFIVLKIERIFYYIGKLHIINSCPKKFYWNIAHGLCFLCHKGRVKQLQQKPHGPLQNNFSDSWPS